MNNLENKNIIVTGASGGIGNSIVKKLNKAGANILASGTRIEKLDIPLIPGISEDQNILNVLTLNLEKVTNEYLDMWLTIEIPVDKLSINGFNEELQL